MLVMMYGVTSFFSQGLKVVHVTKSVSIAKVFFNNMRSAYYLFAHLYQKEISKVFVY